MLSLWLGQIRMRGRVIAIDCHDRIITLQVWEGDTVWGYNFPLRALRILCGTLEAMQWVEVTQVGDLYELRSLV